MPTKKVAPPTTPEVLPKELATVKKQANSLVAPITTTVSTLKVTNPDTYQGADNELAHIRDTRKIIESMFRPVIEPAKATLDAIYALRRTFDTPLDMAEKYLRGEMKAFQLAEQCRIDQENYEKQKVQQRLLREAQELERKAQEANRPQEAAKFEKRASVISQQARDVAQAPVEGPATAQRSTTRTIRKWRVRSIMDLCQGVLDGVVPAGAVIVNPSLRFTADDVQDWPGVEVYNDVQIVGR